ncbi:acyltransferase family protein [Mesorhizobium sp. ANAO-SY3R2]|uniref:acyltransferase family protein n=1 Tax=Mesorhizobium sp. ANAO-SY3R2 TaxID=3166644 RepID=UPI0036704E47
MQFSKIGGTNRLFELECLRGFAAAYVVAFHVLRPELQTYSYLLSVPLRFGQEAVIVFFVLSGFVIRYSWVTATERNWQKYVIARVVRILPIFIAALVVSYFCAVSLRGDLIDPDLRALAGNLAMLQDRPRVGTIVEPYLGNAALWSLSYECAFYALYIVVIQFVPRQLRTPTVAVVSTAAFLLMLAYPNQFARFFAYFPIWWVGVVLCDVHLGRTGHREIAFAIAPVALMGAILLALTLRAEITLEVGASVLFPFLELRHFTAALAVTALLLGWGRLGWSNFASLLGPFAKLAPVSYAIYVVHFPIMTGWRESLPVPFWLGVLLTGTLTLGLSIVLEGPYQKWVGRHVRRFFTGPLPTTGGSSGGQTSGNCARPLFILGTVVLLGLWLNPTTIRSARPTDMHSLQRGYEGPK